MAVIRFDFLLSTVRQPASFKSDDGYQFRTTQPVLGWAGSACATLTWTLTQLWCSCTVFLLCGSDLDSLPEDSPLVAA